MYIERIQVEEGFLDGLDVEFVPGLNVLIGPRGSGKTSLIELLRFCLGSKGVTKRSNDIGLQHAIAILEDGQVTVTLNIDGESIQVTRTADEDAPRSAVEFEPPLVLSQNEIESIGVQAKSRLSLIDGFSESISASSSKELSVLANIRSLTVEMRDLTTEIDAVSDKIDELKSAPEDLEELKAEEQDVLKTVAESAEDQKELERLGGVLAALKVRASVFERTNDTFEKWVDRLDELTSFPPELEDWPKAARAKSDLLESVRQKLAKSVSFTEKASSEAETAVEELEKLADSNQKAILKYEEDARKIRKKINQLKSGAGDITRKVAQAKERVGQLSSLDSLKTSKIKQLSNLQRRRKDLLDELDKLRNSRYRTRKDIAKDLNAKLNPDIDVKVRRAAMNANYEQALSSALRGSGLRFASLSKLLAHKMSPRELAEAVELDDASSIAEYGDITESRASKVVAHLKENGLEEILTASIEDEVDFSLLDGFDYKDSEKASTGQRCTIVLPILLRRYSQPLILDQPEDHLDNAFIVDTLIKSIIERKSTAQLILATHNANIPVLGEAEEVLLLNSDGSQGFVEHVGELDDSESVEAISGVMEGGLEAFNRRALFYRQDDEQSEL